MLFVLLSVFWYSIKKKKKQENSETARECWKVFNHVSDSYFPILTVAEIVIDVNISASVVGEILGLKATMVRIKLFHGSQWANMEQSICISRLHLQLLSLTNIFHVSSLLEILYMV